MSGHSWYSAPASESVTTPPPAQKLSGPLYVPIGATPGATQAATAAKRMSELTDTFQVSSWWKTGSGAASLNTDTEACVAKLGEAHRPGRQTQSTARGLLLCMKDKGWSGLRAK